MTQFDYFYDIDCVLFSQVSEKIVNSHLDQNYFFYQVELLAFCVNLHKVLGFFLLHMRRNPSRNPSDICDEVFFRNNWDKLIKNGPSEICGRQPLKILSDMICLSRLHHFRFFRGCLPQIFLGSLWNILSQLVKP